MQHITAILAIMTMLAASSPQQFAPTGDISDEMVPDGWEFVGNATGDLNGDGRADMIVVARPGEKPMAAVYWDNGDNKWQLFKEYENAFRAFDQMDFAPEYSMEITDDGTLKIELYDPDDFDLTITSSYTFKYKDGDLQLVSEEHYGTADAANKNKKLGDFEIH